MINKIRDWFSVEAHRAYIYRVLLALGAIAVFYGLISQEEVVLIAGAVTTILNIMPIANTSTKSDDDSVG